MHLALVHPPDLRLVQSPPLRVPVVKLLGELLDLQHPAPGRRTHHSLERRLGCAILEVLPGPDKVVVGQLRRQGPHRLAGVVIQQRRAGHFLCPGQGVRGRLGVLRADVVLRHHLGEVLNRLRHDLMGAHGEVLLGFRDGLGRRVGAGGLGVGRQVVAGRQVEYVARISHPGSPVSEQRGDYRGELDGSVKFSRPDFVDKNVGRSLGHVWNCLYPPVPTKVGLTSYSHTGL